MTVVRVALLIVIAALVVTGCSSRTEIPPTLRDDASRETAAPFEVPRLDSEGTLTLAEFSGQPVILNFWASYCAPCREEMPALQAFSEKHPEIAVVGLAVNDDPDASRALAAQTGVTFPLGSDDVSVAEKYGAVGLPATVIIDSRGRVANTWFGEIGSAELEEFAAQLT